MRIAMFHDQSHADAIHSAANLISILKDRFENDENEFPAWQLLELVIESLRSTAERINRENRGQK